MIHVQKYILNREYEVKEKEGKHLGTNDKISVYVFYLSVYYRRKQI